MPKEPQATEAASNRASTSIAIVGVTIEVQGGPDAGLTKRIDLPSFTVGSGAGADVRLRESTVSREHLRLQLGPGSLRVRDPGSRNGTWLGPSRVHDMELTETTVLTLGSTPVLFRFDSGTSSLVISERTEFGGAIGISSAIRHVYAILERAAASDVTLLLEGESGVGKDVLANAVHRESARREGPFVPVDCGAIPANLIESEFFGHERGAFTGAVQQRRGLFQQAEGGTLFLDEIGELPKDLQAKLLRVLETREVRAVGGNTSTKVDVRLIAATNRKLDDAVKQGEFRQDLYYRLAVARVRVPPLRDRVEDILPLATAMLRAATKRADAELPADLAAIFTSHSWPGNVRELRNVIDRYAFLGARELSALFDPSESALRRQGAPNDYAHLPLHEARRRALEDFERLYVPKVLERAGGVVARAAELAEVARPSFYRMISRAQGKLDDE